MKKATVKKQTHLSKRGIDRLEKIMLANGKYFYEQYYFAYTHFKKDGVTECGTELCGAGFCHLLTVGGHQFDKESTRHIKYFSDGFVTRCLRSGRSVLGIKNRKLMVQIFQYSRDWPEDLANGFDNLKTPKARIRFYIKMLRERANADGTLREKE